MAENEPLCKQLEIENQKCLSLISIAKEKKNILVNECEELKAQKLDLAKRKVITAI